MKLAGAVLLYGQPVERTVAAITLDEFPLEDLDGAQEGLVVLRDVADLLIEIVDHFLALGQLQLEGDFVLHERMHLLLQTHDFLLEHHDQLLLLDNQFLRDGVRRGIAVGLE